MVAVLADRIERSAQEDDTTTASVPLASIWVPVETPTAGECSGEALKTDFANCYVKELPSLAWFVMSLGANVHEAADIAQSAFVEAFPKWDSIRHPRAWLRQVAGRILQCLLRWPTCRRNNVR